MRNGGGSFSFSFSSFSFPFHSDSLDDKWGVRKLFPPLVTFASSAKLKFETPLLFPKEGEGGGSGMKGDMGENLLLLPPSLATFGGGGGQEAIRCSSRSFLLKTTISLFFIEKFRFFLVFGRIRLDQICVVPAQSAITAKEGVSSRVCACTLISPM